MELKKRSIGEENTVAPLEPNQQTFPVPWLKKKSCVNESFGLLKYFIIKIEFYRYMLGIKKPEH